MNSTAAKLAAVGLSFLAGCFLVTVSVYLAGYAAARSFSRETLEGLGGHAGLFGLLLALSVQIPSAVVAGVLCWILFKLLGRSSVALVLAASVPWVVTYLEGYLPHVTQNGYVALAGLTGIMCVPGAIYLAARLNRRPHAP